MVSPALPNYWAAPTLNVVEQASTLKTISTSVQKLDSHESAEKGTWRGQHMSVHRFQMSVERRQRFDFDFGREMGCAVRAVFLAVCAIFCRVHRGKEIVAALNATKGEEGTEHGDGDRNRWVNLLFSCLESSIEKQTNIQKT